MNKNLMKKALACMLALTMAAVSSGCGSNDEKTDSKADTTSEVSQADTNASEAEESSSKSESAESEPAESADESGDEEDKTESPFAYYDLMTAKDYECFSDRGVADGVLYYTTNAYEEGSSVYNVRAIDLESGNDRELIVIKDTTVERFVYSNGFIYLRRYKLEYSGNREENPNPTSVTSYIDKYDTNGKLIASFSYTDKEESIGIDGITENGMIAYGTKYITADLKELKSLPEGFHGWRRVAGNKLYALWLENGYGTLSCFDFETETKTEIDVSKLVPKGQSLTDEIYSRGRFLQIGVSNNQYIIIDSDTNEVIARPQGPALSEFYHGPDKSVKSDNSYLSLVRYPADGSDPEYVPDFAYVDDEGYDQDYLGNTSIAYECQVFENGRCFLGYTSSDYDQNYYMYADFKPAEPAFKYYYHDSVGLLTGDRNVDDGLMPQ